MIIKTLVKILKSIEGINIREIQDTQTYPHISFTISSSQSRLLLTYCAESSNINFNSYTCLALTSTKALQNPDMALMYSYSSKSLDIFQNLGAFLVWSLYDIGNIKEELANEYLLVFEAISITKRNQYRFNKRPLCGIDEAGRGPLAGSLVMAGVILINEVEGLMDSKKLSEKKREMLYPLILANSHYHIVSFSAKEVDELGISECLQRGLKSIQKHLPNAEYLFDGNSSFGVDNIKTMVKADTKIIEVSAGSILAKVTHDREMIEMGKVYPLYGFEKHKGYGTKAHREAIALHGRCPLHRKSFKIKGVDYH